MNEINDYLETMFRPYRQTPRLLEAKAELQGMMEDAYAGHIAQGATANEAMVQIVTDFGNLDELAPSLGITADLASGGEVQTRNVDVAPETIHPPITMEEAQGFAEVHRKTAVRLGIGVALYVVAAIPLVVLLGASDGPDFPINAGVAISIGLVVALIVGAIATMLLIGISGQFAPYVRLQERRFSPDRGVIRWVNELARDNARRLTTALTIAVFLWVLSPTALIVISLAPESPRQSLLIGASTALLLLIVAVGLFVYLRATWASSAANVINSGVEKPAAARA